MKPEFTLIDFVKIAPDKNLSKLSKVEKVKLIDHYLDPKESNRKRGLAIDWYLSHSGRRINNRIYTVKGQQQGIDSLLSPYPKAILRQHNSEEDPIGRFTGGHWESLHSEAVGFFSNLNDFMKVQDAFEKDDPERIYKVLKDYNLLTNKKWPGLGRMNVSGRITDEVAIEKFLDGRYITFSAGSTTDRHVCSICLEDWALGNYCEHSHGKIYDGEICVFITGKFEVLEGSVVNMPGDDFSQIHSMNILDTNNMSSKTQRINMDCINIDPTTIYITDSNYYLEKDMEPKDVEVSKDSVEATDTEVIPQGQEEDSTSQEDTSEEVADVSTDVSSDDSTADVQADSDNKLIDMLIDALKIRGFISTEAKDVASSTETKKEEAAVQDSIVQPDTQATDEKEKEEKVEASDGASEGGVHEKEVLVDWYLLGLALDFELGEAKLSKDEKEKLSDEVFCGPDRSFPIADLAHAEKARQIVEKATLSSDSKEKILASIDEKAKAFSGKEALLDLKRDYSEALIRIETLEAKLKEAIEKIALDKKDTISYEKDDNKLEVLLSYLDKMTNAKDVETKEVVKIEDPSISSSDESSNVNAAKKKLGSFEQNVLTNYSTILEKDGRDAAEAFLRSKKRYLPRGFHPSKL